MTEVYNEFKESLSSVGISIDNDKILVSEKDDIFIMLSQFKKLYDNNATIHIANQIANNLLSKPIYRKLEGADNNVEFVAEWQDMFRNKLKGYRYFQELDATFMEPIDWNSMKVSNSSDFPSRIYKRPSPSDLNGGLPSTGHIPNVSDIRPDVINVTPITTKPYDDTSAEGVLAMYDDPLALSKPDWDINEAHDGKSFITSEESVKTYDDPLALTKPEYDSNLYTEEKSEIKSDDLSKPEWDINASNDSKAFVKTDDALDTLFLRVLFDALTGPKWLVKIADESTGEYHFLVSDSINRSELCFIEIAVAHPHGSMKISDIYRFNKCARRVDDGVKFFDSNDYESWHNIMNDTPSKCTTDNIVQYGDEEMFKEFCQYMMNANAPVEESISHEVSGEHVLTKTVITALHKLALFVNKYPKTFKDLIVNDRLLPYTLVVHDPTYANLRLFVPRYNMKNDEWLFWEAGYMQGDSPMLNPMIYDTYLNVRMSHFESDIHYLGFKMIDGDECDFLSADVIIENADSAKDIADAIPHLFSEVK